MIRIKATKTRDLEKKIYKVTQIEGVLKINDLPIEYFKERPYCCLSLLSYKHIEKPIKCIVIYPSYKQTKRYSSLSSGFRVYRCNWNDDRSIAYIFEGGLYFPDELEKLLSFVRDCAKKLRTINKWAGEIKWEI